MAKRLAIDRSKRGAYYAAFTSRLLALPGLESPSSNFLKKNVPNPYIEFQTF